MEPAGSPPSLEPQLAVAAGGVGAMVAEANLVHYDTIGVATVASYSWNAFRYIGDYLHLFGAFSLLATLAKNRSCTGLSRGTQVLYFLVFATRYLDLFERSQIAYLVFFKVSYIASSVIGLLAFWRLDATYERQKDTCNISVLLLPCIVAAIILASDYTKLEIMWSFSQFLEGFAMVPQYIFCYRDKGATDFGVSLYVIATGGYRVFYAANWIYKKVFIPTYSDVHSWIGGVIEISFFCDYLLSRFTGCSVLRTLVLQVDEKINVVGSKVTHVLGRPSYASPSEEGGSELRQRRVGAAEGGREENLAGQV